ncbi:hypothetical protein ES708_04633 [subsurface metagenome]
MKKFYFAIFALLLIAISGNALAGTPHTALGRVYNYDGSTPANNDIQFQAYIVDRPGQIFTENSIGCGYESGYWNVNVGNFPTAWTAGEVLQVNATNTATGMTGSIYLTLTNTDPDEAGDLVFPPIQYTLTMAVNPVEGGNTNPAVGVSTYSEGTIVPIEATPAEGYRFVNWTGDVADANSPTTTVTMNSNKPVTANFVPVYILTMVANPANGGTTSPAVGDHQYDKDDVVDISAAPALGYRFVEWIGDVADPNSASTTVTMNDLKTVTAKFIRQYSLTITEGVPPKGGTTDPPSGMQIYDDGDIVPISAAPAVNYRFDNWTGDVGSVADTNSASTTVTITGNISLTPNYVRQYTLTMAVNPEGSGTTTPPLGDNKYDEGTVVNISTTPALGWSFVEWIGAVADPSSASTTVTMDADKTVTANFDPLYILTMIADPANGGTTTPAAGNHEYVEDEVVAITATPAAGYRFVEWIGAVADPSNASTTVTMDVTKVVTAKFVLVYNLTIIAEPANGGTTSPAVGVHQYDKDDVVDISTTPAAGYRFVEWIGAVVDPTSASTTVTMDSAKAITAKFIRQYTLTITAGVPPEGGTTDPPAGAQLYDEGAVVPISALPSVNYRFGSWTGDVGSVFDPNSASTTVTITGDISLTPNYIRQYTLTMVADPVNGGTTTPVLGDNIYDEGTVVSIAATSDLGFRFDSWAGDVADPGNVSTTVTMNADKTVTANFFPVYNLTMEAEPANGGTTTPAVGDHEYDKDQVVAITATPALGYRFLEWIGAVADPTSASTTVTMDTAKIVTAKFIRQYKLTMAANPTDGGTTDPVVGVHIYDEDTIVDITASPNEGFGFADWIGDVADPDNASTTVIMNSDKNVTAKFGVLYTLTMAAAPEGTGTTEPPPGDHIYIEGTVLPITAIPEPGYGLDNWTGNTGDVADPNSAETTVTINSNISLTANFVPVVNMTIEVDPPGSGLTDPPLGEHIYNTGTTVPISVTPYVGYRFERWSDNVADQSSNATSVFMDTDKVVTATMIPLYELIITATEGGTTFPALGSYVYEIDTVVTITAIPDENYLFDGWEGDVADPFSAETTVTMDSPKTIRAKFKTDIMHTLTMAVTPEGGGTTDPPPGDYEYGKGAEVPIQAIPDPNFRFLNWTGVVTDPDSASTTVTMDADKAITANFEEVYTLTVEQPLAGGTTDPPPGDYVYRKGEEVPILAIPDPNFQFLNWMGDAVAEPDSASTTVTMDADKVITANFGEVYILTIEEPLEGGGTTDPPPGEYPHVEGDIVPILAIPDPEFRFLNWSGNTEAVAEPDSASTTVLMDGNKTVTATFIEIAPFTIIANPPEGGTTDPPPGTYEYNQGTVIQLEAIPNELYRFTGWTSNVADPDTAAVTSVIVTSEDIIITANFSRIYKLTIDESEGGITIPEAGESIHLEGAEVFLEAIPGEGYRFGSWIGNDADSTSAAISVIMDEDKTVTPVFIRQYKLTTEVNPEGAVIFRRHDGAYRR